ncbi:MAG: SLC13 family permease [Oscillospiraceae bacterium]
MEKIKEMGSAYWIKWALCLALLIGISLFPPFAGLEPVAMRCLAILVFIIFVMIFRLIDEFLAGLLGLCLLFFLKVADTTGAALSGFTTSTFVLLLGAFGMGGVLAQCGSLARIANAIVSIFPKTFRGRVSAMYLAGMVVSPCLSSGSAKGVIMSLISCPTAKNMGYKKESNAAAGLFMAGWIPVGVIGICFLSGAVSGPLLAGLTEGDAVTQFTWVKWFVNALPFLVVMLVGCYFANLFLYKPKAGDVEENFVIDTTVKKAEKMNSKQILSLVIIAAVVICWIFAKKLGLVDCWVAAAGLVLMLLFGCIDRKKGVSVVPWGTLMFSAWVLTISNLMGTVGLSKAITETAGQYVIPLMNNLWLCIPVLCGLIYIIRLVVISQTLVTSVMYVLLMPIAVAAGVNPWIIGFICGVTICTWNILPQSIPFLSAFGAADGYISFPKCVKMSVFVMIWQIVALWVSIPFWSLMGLC